MWSYLEYLVSRVPLARSLLPVSDGQEVLTRAVELARADHAPAPARSGDAPLISFVAPVYNAPPAWIDDLVNSFAAQAASGVPCELVLSDDASPSEATRARLVECESQPGVRVVRGEQNGGIAVATNRGLAAARGEWVGLIDHDDALAPFAVERIARALAARPDCAFLYTDEIIANRWMRPETVFLKPAFDEALLSGVNYINHLSLYRRDRLMELGGLRVGFEGSQDYDLVLRYTKDLPRSRILHLPYPAYIWRRDGASYSARFLGKATDSARRALGERYAADGAPATVGPAMTPDLHRVRFDARKTAWPRVSVVIPSKDRLELISRTLEGLTRGTDYPDFEIIVIDNGSEDPAVLDLYARHREGNIPFRAEIRPESFNFSRSINRGLGLAGGDLILLLNNDIEVVDPGWLKEMVSCLEYEGTGIVGARLLYPDGTIQHAGVIVGFGGLAGHWYVGEKGDHPGPMGRLRVRQGYSCVTGACFLITRACLGAVGPLDEEAFAIAYNDVDFCMRALAAGFRIVWTPFATLIHHESASRGSDELPATIERFRREQANLRDRHRTDLYEDPACNPWYTKGRSNPGIARLTSLPPPR